MHLEKELVAVALHLYYYLFDCVLSVIDVCINHYYCPDAEFYR